MTTDCHGRGRVANGQASACSPPGARPRGGAAVRARAGASDRRACAVAAMACRPRPRGRVARAGDARGRWPGALVAALGAAWPAPGWVLTRAVAVPGVAEDAGSGPRSRGSPAPRSPARSSRSPPPARASRPDEARTLAAAERDVGLAPVVAIALAGRGAAAGAPSRIGARNGHAAGHHRDRRRAAESGPTPRRSGPDSAATAGRYVYSNAAARTCLRCGWRSRSAYWRPRCR